jgi:polysaccharide pyruvyl transferase WcaK-like protein
VPDPRQRIRTSGPGLRILVQGGSYELDNLGDLSMLGTLLERITERVPRARVAIFSRNAEQVRRLSPRLESIPVEEKRHWQIARSGYLRLRETFPIFDRGFRLLLPRVYESLLQLKARQLVNREALRQCDLLLLSGGGYLTDVFPGQAWSALERLEAAVSEGVPFALLGHGIGPLRDPAIMDSAARLLPRAQLISVRERRVALSTLMQLGVAPERIVVTGDDSVEAAYRRRLPNIGSRIGVTLRVADYAGMTAADAKSLRAPLESAARQLETHMLSLPVCIRDSVESASDATVASLLLGDAGNRDSQANWIPQTPEQLIDRVALCRVVVAGSYHAAVFALSQGIPAVCLFNCEYYEIKFRGLAAEFGIGCQVLDKAAHDLASSLVESIMRAWANAEVWRPGLLDAAREQIEAGHRAYDRVLGAMDARHSAIAGVNDQ